jgi:hypothetical protein
MTVNVAKELAALRRMSVDDLRARYAEVFGEATNGRHKDWLIKRIIYRQQRLRSPRATSAHSATWLGIEAVRDSAFAVRRSAVLGC